MGGGHLLQRRNNAWFKRFVPAASHGLVLLACAGFCAGLPTQALGQGAPMPSIVSSSPEATLLRQIQQAARHLNYEGVFTFQQGESIESSRLTHVFDGKDEKERIFQKLAHKINKAGCLVCVVSDTRSQLENKLIALKKLQLLIAQSLIVPKKRKNTKPTKGSIEKRLESKKKQSDKKSNRSTTDWK